MLRLLCSISFSGVELRANVKLGKETDLSSSSFPEVGEEPTESRVSTFFLPPPRSERTSLFSPFGYALNFTWYKCTDACAEAPQEIKKGVP